MSFVTWSRENYLQEPHKKSGDKRVYVPINKE